MMWTTEQALNGLYILVAVMLVVVLYHVLFIVVDLRKTLRRIELITRELESVLMKPLFMTDKILSWVLQQVEALGDGTHDKKKHGHHGK